MENFSTNVKNIQLAHENINSIYKPLFFRIYNAAEFAELQNVLLTPGIKIFDSIKGQLKELIKFQNPSKRFTDEELEMQSTIHIGKLSIDQYGVWVYYPWTNRLVHVLDKTDFIDVRTSRNQNKITLEERNTLLQKRIGIIGLSVGQSVSVTIAMERICSEIRLADFDLLELTNLNRIRTGVHNLGLPKVYSVAREISEIDPFIKVVCYPEGLTELNMDDFFLKDGKLDLLIEESDGFDIKILSRYKAKELGIPVVMEASDRCTVDVERFDMEPNRSILHGIVDHLNIETLKSLKTTEEKIPYMLDVLGIETSSLRLRASMLEIEQSINTWPQLASAVTMGGGIATDVSRRLLLNQFTESGRYHVDIDQIIGDVKLNDAHSDNYFSANATRTSLSNGEMHAIASRLSIREPNYSPSTKEIELIVESAMKAPSQGNRQAWKWYFFNGNLFLFHDTSVSSILLDYDYIDSYISFGAATENLILKSHEVGLNPDVILFPEKKDNRLICQITFLNEKVSTDKNEYNCLSSQIDSRLTNRTISERQIINNDIISEIQKTASSIDGIQLKIIDNFTDIEQLAEILAEAERLKILDENGHSDFIDEIRWSEREVIEKRDGIDLNSFDINATEKAGLVVAKDWEVVKLIKQWKRGSTFEKLPRKIVLTSSALGLIVVQDYSPVNYFNAGRSIQRAWLMASKLNVSIQPMSSLTSLFVRIIKGNGIGLDDELKSELIKLKSNYDKIIELPTQSKGIFLFKLFVNDSPKGKSLRKVIDNVLIHG
jgi:tRNA A37 threonylcarbamoyladenosine dehydratase